MAKIEGPSRSLRTRFSLFVSVLLLAILGAFSFAAYGEVRDGLTRVAETRLASAAEQLTSLLDQAVTQQTSTLRSLLERSEVLAFIEDPDAGTGEAVTALLDSATEAAPARLGMIVRLEDGTVLLAGDAEASGVDSLQMGVNPFVREGDRIAYSVALPIEVAGERRGTLVDHRTVPGNPQTGQLIRDLIGEDAVFFVGHRTGDLWTDLSGQVSDFRPSGGPGVMMPDTVSGAPVLGMVGGIGTTPWAVWVGLPRSVVSGPLRSFLGRMGGTTLLFALLGGVGAWTLGRRVTRPLADLTEAAEAIEVGDYSRRITTDRNDEIGRLAGSFDAMARKVEEGRERLEQRVADRTAELEEALQDLEAAQEELVKKERLAILGELAGGVGHELRNPLGVMTNAVYYLEVVLKDRPDVVDEYLEILRNQIHISEKIVGDLLDFARVQPPQRKDVDVAGLVEKQLDRAAVDTDGIDVRMEFPDGLPRAHVDPDQVAQVVLNLVTNAFQAMEENGGTLTLRGTARDGRVRIEVEDEGPGIPPKELETIFQPLFTTKPKGIGLGLSVSRSLTEANEGSLSAKNVADGGGALFLLELPGSPTRESEA